VITGNILLVTQLTTAHCKWLLTCAAKIFSLLWSVTVVVELTIRHAGFYLPHCMWSSSLPVLAVPKLICSPHLSPPS